MPLPPTDETPYWLGGIMIGVLGFLFKHHFNQINEGLAKKADRTEIAELRIELKESREARERDIERVERLGSERYAEMQRTFNQRIDDMQKHLDSRLDMIIHQMGK